MKDSKSKTKARVTCPDCRGYDSMGTCTRCKGTGVIRKSVSRKVPSPVIAGGSVTLRNPHLDAQKTVTADDLAKMSPMDLVVRFEWAPTSYVDIQLFPTGVTVRMNGPLVVIPHVANEISIQERK